MLHLVTSANHVPRVLRDATLAFADLANVVLTGVPAHTCYGGKAVADVEIRDLGD